MMGAGGREESHRGHCFMQRRLGSHGPAQPQQPPHHHWGACSRPEEKGPPSSPLPYCCWVLLECDRLKPIPLLDSAKRPAP